MPWSSYMVYEIWSSHDQEFLTTGILTPVNGWITIPLYGKLRHVLTMAHMSLPASNRIIHHVTCFHRVED